MQIIVDADSRRLSLGPTPPVRGETIPGTLTFMKGGVPFRLPAGTAIQIGVKSWNDPSDVLLAYTTATRPEPDGAPYTFSLSLNTSEMLAKFTAGVTRYDCSIEVKWEVSAGSGTFKKTQRHKYSVDADTVRDTDANPSTMLSRNDFLVTNGTGLLVNVAAGYAANGAFVAAQASLAITNATNYIEVTAAGVASVNTTAFTAGSYPLATVVASAGAITSNTDLRAWITPKPAAGGGVTSITGTANEITVTGTTTPTLSLPSALTFTGKTVTGGTFASPSLTTPTIGDGTEAAPSLSFTSDTNTGVYRPAADTVGIVGGGNDVVRMTGIASATDYLEIKNGIGVGSPLHVLAEGASANIGVHLQPKGSGLFTISDGTDFNKGIRFRSSSSAASAITLLDAVSTAGRVVTLPDATGTLALVSGDLGTPSALVGTNITGTASGLTAGNATLAATVTVANEATDTSCFPLFATAATGSLAALSNAGLTFNSATGLLSATGMAGAFNGTVGATTPSTVAGTTGTFSGSVSTSGANASIYTNGSDANIYATGSYATVYTTGASGYIYTTGASAQIYTTGQYAHIYTTGANAYIESRSTFKLFGGTYYTTLSHAATANRDIAFPDATGTLALVSGNLGTPSALVGTNITGTAASLTAGTVTTNANLTGHVTSVGNAAVLGSFTMAQLSAAVSDGDPAYVGAANTFTAANVFNHSATFASGIHAAKIQLGSTAGAGIGIDIVPLNSPTQPTAGRSWMRVGGGSSDYLMINAGLTGGYVDFCQDLGSGVRVCDGTGGHRTYLTAPATGTLRVTTDGSTLGTVDAATFTGNAATATKWTTGRTIALTGDVTYTSGALDGSGNVTGTATLANIPAISGANLTTLNASNVSSGTLAAAQGGTGISNTGTITLGGNLVTTGAFNTTFAQAATTTVTLPSTSATMARTDAAQTFTGVQSMTSPSFTTSITTPSTTFAIANTTATTLNIGGAATTIAMGAAGAGTMNIPLTTSASSATTGALTIGNGTAATNVGIGGGNINAGGTIVAGGNISSQYITLASGRITINSGASTTSRLTNGSTSGWIIVDNQSGVGGALLLGSGSGNPGIFRSGTTLQVRLADNSADAPISASNGTLSGTLSVTGATTLTGNLTSNGALISTPQALSGNGAVAAVNLTTEITTIANTGTANTTTTLAAGTNGQKKVISFITDGGFDAVITVTNPAWGGAGTITMNDALDNIELRYLNSVWQVFINNGCTLA